MRGQQTIHFDFPIRYGDKGQYAETNQITVRAPGLGKLHVHNVMTAKVGEAITSLQMRRRQLMQGQPAPDETDEDEDNKKDADDETQPEAWMGMMAIGLGSDDYNGFFNFVLKALTGTPKLAVVGDSSSTVPITDEVWENIEAGGGMEAVERVLGAFVGFFLGSHPSKEASGKSSSTSSASPTKGSTPSKQKTSRLVS